MTTLHRIMDAICRALATSGVVRWEGEFVMVSEAQEIGLGRQGAAEVMAAGGRVPQSLRIRIARAPRAMSLEQFNSEMPSSIPLTELALINGLDETAQLRAGQPVKRVTGTVMARAN